MCNAQNNRERKKQQRQNGAIIQNELRNMDSLLFGRCGEKKIKGGDNTSLLEKPKQAVWLGGIKMVLRLVNLSIEMTNILSKAIV